MHLAVLASGNSWYLNDLRRAAAHRHRIDQVAFDLLRSHLHGSAAQVHSQNRDLAEYSAVLVRTMPPGSLERVVFRMDALAQLEATGTPVINSPRAIESAVDKYLALAKLQAVGLPIPPTVVCQSKDDAMDAFSALGGDVVVKPLFGGEGRGICRIADPDVAFRTFKALLQIDAVLYLQQFIDHEGCDLRLFVVGDEVLGIRRRNPSDWRTNVSRGAIAEPLDITIDLMEIAQRAARAVGAEIAGVDLLDGRDGRRWVLEVNAVPGWKALAETLEMDVAARVLTFIETRVEIQE
ncbi:MAG: RimK family alpha-L-glutamate ligase [Pirellulaceae bacterium]|jgi:ribosomal protein S6--L-glutamate ligase|nr:30S ribosomal protein S6--L-glutamate ligase [Planctomycetaceae bacterium]MDP6469332.1 RimK family alpha-L-glutamate ligase [Pirellulaceae bacterium]MDP6555383.1 RimK family alpha-L-glutamate ligase [Pirellulaceae bacterium]MDP6717060.1 RimK family alpha-L-glutamate ligase [Pirellulaceae bacterium]